MSLLNSVQAGAEHALAGAAVLVDAGGTDRFTTAGVPPACQGVRGGDADAPGPSDVPTTTFRER